MEGAEQAPHAKRPELTRKHLRSTLTLENCFGDGLGTLGNLLIYCFLVLAAHPKELYVLTLLAVLSACTCLAWEGLPVGLLNCWGAFVGVTLGTYTASNDLADAKLAMAKERSPSGRRPKGLWASMLRFLDNVYNPIISVTFVVIRVLMTLLLLFVVGGLATALGRSLPVVGLLATGLTVGFGCGYLVWVVELWKLKQALTL